VSGLLIFLKALPFFFVLLPISCVPIPTPIVDVRGVLISCLSQKGEKEVSSFHTILLSWSSQQKAIYIREECATMLVTHESL
jgi:hypothetical protein